MINIGVFFGGRSVEHEVSVITALQAVSVLSEMDGYRAIPVYIAKSGDWYTGGSLMEIDNFKNIPKMLKSCDRVFLRGGEQKHTAELALCPVPRGSAAGTSRKKPDSDDVRVDIAFPIVHGTGGEDGTLQGLFELLEIPYIGCNPLAAAISMDKVTTKNLLRGFRQAEMRWFYSHNLPHRIDYFLDTCEKGLSYPMIVKPCDLGSSIGVRTAHDREELREAIAFSSQFTSKIMVESKLTDIFEINISVLGDRESQELSVCERPKSASEFLTYEDKYMGTDSAKGMASLKREIPANIPDKLRLEIESLARSAFLVLDCSGVCRIDFLVDRETQTPYLCELNTIPGSLAFYLWKASGKSFRTLLENLIEIAHRAHRRKRALERSSEINLLDKDNLRGIKK